MIKIIPKEDVRPKKSIIEHHEKYEEIHGEDKTVFITISEHKLLHRRLRKEDKCNIPPEELHKISRSAYMRTKKWQEKYDEYLESEEYQGRLKRIKEKNIYDKIYETDIKRQKILDKIGK